MQRDVFQPGDMAGKYEIQRLIGAGGHAEVYLAMAPEGSHVAVKCLQLALRTSDHLKQRFFNEGRVLRAIDNVHVVRFLDFGVADPGVPWMAMELLQGKMLRDYLHDQGGRLGIEKAFRFARQIARAALAAHALKVYHRDLKPENIIVLPGDVLKVFDFGIAKLVGWNNKTTLKTELCGTPLYMAPEQFQGEKTDARTDVYALGVILYEMCLGQSPFVEEGGEAPAQEGIQESQRRGPKPLPAVLAGFAPYLWAPIARALAYCPDDRWATMLEFGEAIGQALKRWLREHRPPELPLSPPPGATPVMPGAARDEAADPAMDKALAALAAESSGVEAGPQGDGSPELTVAASVAARRGGGAGGTVPIVPVPAPLRAALGRNGTELIPEPQPQRHVARASFVPTAMTERIAPPRDEAAAVDRSSRAAWAAAGASMYARGGSGQVATVPILPVEGASAESAPRESRAALPDAWRVAAARAEVTGFGDAEDAQYTEPEDAQYAEPDDTRYAEPEEMQETGVHETLRGVVFRASPPAAPAGPEAAPVSRRRWLKAALYSLATVWLAFSTVLALLHVAQLLLTPRAPARDERTAPALERSRGLR